MRCLLLLVLFSFSSFAQHASQPEKESSDDLRHGMTLFQLQDLEEDISYWLERTANMEYFLKMKEDKEEKILKISSPEAKQLDREFASKFLKCQYELPASAEGCKASLHLTMKGEVQEICGKDEKKTQEFAPFAKALGKRF